MNISALARSLDDLMARGAPSLVLRIESAEGEVLFEAARGMARADQAEPMSPTTPLHMASVTKTMTAALVMRLLEEGAFGTRGLEITLAELELFSPGVLARLARTGGEAWAANINVRDLLSHTSGLRDAFEDDCEQLGGAPGSLGAALSADLTRAYRYWPAWDALRPDDAEAGVINWYLNRGLGDAPLAPPGRQFHYSDTGYMVLGLVCERVGRAPLARLYRKHLFDPLGLTATYLSYHEDPPGLGPRREPEADVWSGGRALLSAGVNLGFDWGGGGLVSTPKDMIAFFRGMLQGKLFARPETLATMLARHAPEGLAPPRTHIGFGVDYLQARGVTLIGRTGSWGARMMIEPATGRFMAGTVNIAGALMDWHFAVMGAASAPA